MVKNRCHHHAPSWLPRWFQLKLLLSTTWSNSITDEHCEQFFYKTLLCINCKSLTNIWSSFYPQYLCAITLDWLKQTRIYTITAPECHQSQRNPTNSSTRQQRTSKTQQTPNGNTRRRDDASGRCVYLCCTKWPVSRLNAVRLPERETVSFLRVFFSLPFFGFNTEPFAPFAQFDGCCFVLVVLANQTVVITYYIVERNDDDMPFKTEHNGVHSRLRPFAVRAP